MDNDFQAVDQPSHSYSLWEEALGQLRDLVLRWRERAGRFKYSFKHGPLQH